VSLAEKFEEWKNKTPWSLDILAFYAGAEAAVNELSDSNRAQGPAGIEAEIDHFRSHK